MGDKLHSVLGKAARIVMLIYLIFPASVGHVIHLRSPNIYPRSFCSLTESCKYWTRSLVKGLFQEIFFMKLFADNFNCIHVFHPCFVKERSPDFPPLSTGYLLTASYHCSMLPIKYATEAQIRVSSHW